MMLLGVLAAQSVTAAVQAILPNGTFDTADGWTVTGGTGGGVANGVLRIVNQRGGSSSAEHATAALLPNRTYRIDGDMLEGVAGAEIRAFLGGTSVSVAPSGAPSGKFSVTVTTGSNPTSLFKVVGGGTVLDNIVVTLLPL